MRIVVGKCPAGKPSELSARCDISASAVHSPQFTD
jgi:hypothetical protein